MGNSSTGKLRSRGPPVAASPSTRNDKFFGQTPEGKQPTIAKTPPKNQSVLDKARDRFAEELRMGITPAITNLHSTETSGALAN